MYELSLSPLFFCLARSYQCHRFGKYIWRSCHFNSTYGMEKRQRSIFNTIHTGESCGCNGMTDIDVFSLCFFSWCIMLRNFSRGASFRQLWHWIEWRWQQWKITLVKQTKLIRQLTQTHSIRRRSVSGGSNGKRIHTKSAAFNRSNKIFASGLDFSLWLLPISWVTFYFHVQ